MSISRWKNALDTLADRNRVHVSSDTSAAYRDLASVYDNCEIISFPTGDTQSYWEVPPAWEVERATLTAPDGKVIADWNESKLSVFSCSPPFCGKISLQDLETHLFSIPQKPQRIPFHFRNQYRHWDQQWGFCISHHVRDKLVPGQYDVDIATRFQPGKMEMVEQTHAGELSDTILLVGHFDHPAMCNDGLVGCLAGHEIISRLAERKTHLTYRMLSTIEIIGSVFYAARCLPSRHVRQALFIATAGARAPLHYQQSFSERSPIDRVMKHIFTHYAEPDEAENIDRFRQGPLGNDETAFDVGGVNIPCGVVMRGPFDEYHTDADNVDAVDEERFEQQVEIVLKAIDVFEKNAVLSRCFSGLPCLSAPALDLYFSYSRISQVAAPQSRHPISTRLGPKTREIYVKNPDALHYMATVLPVMCEGDKTVLDVAEKVGLPFEIVDAYTDLWVEKGLIKKFWSSPFSTFLAGEQET